MKCCSNLYTHHWIFVVIYAIKKLWCSDWPFVSKMSQKYLKILYPQKFLVAINFSINFKVEMRMIFLFFWKLNWNVSTFKKKSNLAKFHKGSKTKQSKTKFEIKKIFSGETKLIKFREISLYQHPTLIFSIFLFPLMIHMISPIVKLFSKSFFFIAFFIPFSLHHTLSFYILLHTFFRKKSKRHQLFF